LMQAEGMSRRDASSEGAFAHAQHTWSRVNQNRHEMRWLDAVWTVSGPYLDRISGVSHAYVVIV
jgi:trehalose-6-phosphatase